MVTEVQLIASEWRIAGPGVIYDRLRQDPKVRRCLHGFRTSTGFQLRLAHTLPPVPADFVLHSHDRVPCPHIFAASSARLQACVQLHTRLRAQAVKHATATRAICAGGRLHLVTPIVAHGRPVALLELTRLPEQPGSISGSQVDGYGAILHSIASAIGAIAERNQLTRQSIALPDVIALAMEFAERNCADPLLDIRTVSARIGVVPQQLAKLFLTSLGTTFPKWLAGRRVLLAMCRLRESRENILGIARSCCFSALSTFNRIFRQQTGVTPTSYRRRSASDSNPALRIN